jgi:hypothetical protein
VVQLPAALADHGTEEISVVFACTPMWHNVQTYQTITNNPCPRLMLNFCWCLHGILSAVTHKVNVSGHVLVHTFFLALVCETRAQILSENVLVLYNKITQW